MIGRESSGSSSSTAFSTTSASFFSSFVPTIHADAPPEEPPAKDSAVEADAEVVENNEKAGSEHEVDEKVVADDADEEPEDLHPILRDECKASAKCAALTKHFEHCQEKVHSGQGFKGEDCVEELFHMMHCVEAETAPKLFAKLR